MGEQINYNLRDTDKSRHVSIIVLSFDHLVVISKSLSDGSRKRSAIFYTGVWLQLRTSRAIICNKHWQTIISRQLFAGHVVGSATEGMYRKCMDQTAEITKTAKKKRGKRDGYSVAMLSIVRMV